MVARIVLISLGLAAIGLTQAVDAQLADPNAAGVSFGHVHMNVSDVELHKKLWSEVFGGVVIEREGYVAIRVPGVLLFLRDAEPTAPSRGSAVDHFGFKVKNVAAVLSQWRSLGYEVDNEHVDEQGSSTAHITMPNGATLALTEASAISSVAEMDHVHFSTTEADGLAAWYQHMFGAQVENDGEVNVTASVPGARLMFDSSDSKGVPIEGTAIDHIGFEVESVERLAELLREEGINIDFGPRYFESLDLWVAFFTDESGALIEITQGLDW